jgi:hypothetical protein
MVEPSSHHHRLPRRVPRLRAHQRVLLVTLAALVGAGVGFGVTMSGSNHARAEVRRVTDRLEPIDAELAKVERAARTGQARFEDALVTSDSGIRTAALQEAETATQNGQKAWATYRHMALGLPGERPLQQRYEREAKASRDAGVVLFTTDIKTHPLEYATAAVALRQSGESTQLDVGALRVRYQHQINLTQRRAAAYLDRLRGDVELVFAVAVLVGLGIAGLMLAGAAREERAARRREIEQNRQIRRSDLETRVQRGLEMTRT